MSTKRVLFVSGGWDGHKPHEIVEIFRSALAVHGFESEVEVSLDVLADAEWLKTFAVIFPCWTMGTLTKEQSQGLQDAVRSGVGLAGIHGGMGDAFRGNLDYEWMTGGHFVGHPHVGDYTVNVCAVSNPIVTDMTGTFAYRSEQYYLMVDPAIEVLADTSYVYEGRACTMPVAWVKTWGEGRVFYSALGHAPEEFTTYPVAKELTVRGVLWAARML
ncbi:MAG: ThuA domain-containing protein [Opitutaceae bacterium]|jgi:hypothetical protein